MSFWFKKKYLLGSLTQRREKYHLSQRDIYQNQLNSCAFNENKVFTPSRFREKWKDWHN